MATRKHNSLFGPQLKIAMGLDTVSLKSEDLPVYRPFYVDVAMIDRIHNNANQLIVGRRGTGKTHLLGTLNEIIHDECPTEMSVMMSLMNVSSKTPPSHDTESKSFSRKRLAKTLFEGFIRKFFDLFLVEAAKRLRQLQSIAYDQALHEQVNDHLQQLLEAIEVGTPFVTKRTQKRTDRTTAQESDTSSFNLGAVLNGFRPKFSASAIIGGKDVEAEKHETETAFESTLSIDLDAVREKVLAILNDLQIEVLYVLIDEWMELDKRTPSDIQPLFAQYLKSTFFNTNRIAVKIASVWHETTLYDKDDLKRSRGIQLKHDITRELDLDTAFITSASDARDFCKLLLFKRLAFRCEDIRPLANADGEVDDIFVTELFDNEDNFKAFITASHGIPRDLMDIFQKCSLRIRRDFATKCISHDLVFAVSKSIYSTDKRKNIDPTSVAQQLLTQVNQYMERTSQRIFLVENSKMGQSSALRKLIDEELLHQVPSAVTPRCIRDTHKALLIDFGNYVDWVTTKRLDLSLLLKETVLASFPESFDDTWEAYVIDIDALDPDILSCPSCEKKVRKTHPVFKKLRACPSCGDAIP